MQKQTDLGFWEKPLRVIRPEITYKLIQELFDEKMLYASLMARSTNPLDAAAAKGAFSVLMALRKDLEGRLRL